MRLGEGGRGRKVDMGGDRVRSLCDARLDAFFAANTITC